MGRNPEFFEKYVNPICKFQFFKLISKIAKENNLQYRFITKENQNKSLLEKIFGKANIRGIVKLYEPKS